jgi:hypothetical protein
MALDRVDEIKDLLVLINRKMAFLPNIEAIIPKSLRVLGFIKCSLRELCGRIDSRFQAKKKNYKL